MSVNEIAFAVIFNDKTIFKEEKYNESLSCM